jgi:hypothetical protein
MVRDPGAPGQNSRRATRRFAASNPARRCGSTSPIGVASPILPGRRRWCGGRGFHGRKTIGASSSPGRRGSEVGLGPHAGALFWRHRAPSQDVRAQVCTAGPDDGPIVDPGLRKDARGRSDLGERRTDQQVLQIAFNHRSVRQCETKPLSCEWSDALDAEHAFGVARCRCQSNGAMRFGGEPRWANFQHLWSSSRCRRRTTIVGLIPTPRGGSAGEWFGPWSAGWSRRRRRDPRSAGRTDPASR